MAYIVSAERTLAPIFKKIYLESKQEVFLIPQRKINRLIAYKHLLFTKQKQNILNALETGSGVHLKLTKTQQGSGFGTFLASLGILLAIEAINW